MSEPTDPSPPMEDKEAQSSLAPGVLINPPTSTGNNMPTPCPDSLTPHELERLGRQRPAVFRTAATEAGFVFTILMSMMMSEYCVSGFSIVLPAISSALGIPPALQTWPAGVNSLATSALLLPMAQLCDRCGARAVFLAGLAWLLAWSLGAGFVRGTSLLIVCRAMQGIGAAAFLPAGLALLGQTYRPGPRKNLVFGIYGAFAVVGFYFGIIVGALAAQFLSWRWYFWIGTLICLVVLVSGLFTIPRHLGDADPTVQMDWWGIVTIVPALGLIVFAINDGGSAPHGWKTPYIYVTLGLGLVLLGAAVYVEGWVSKQPLLPPALFRPKYMKRLVAGLFCSYGVFGIFLFYASYYLQTVLHTGPLQTAAWFSPLAAGGMVLAIGGGFLLHLLPGRVLMIISGTGYVLCVLLFAVMPERDAATGQPSESFLYWAYVFPAMLCGTIGVDITFNVTNVYITTAMPRRLQGAASGLINSIIYLGIVFWLGVAELAQSATVELASGEGRRLSKLQQYRIGFWTGLGLAVLSLSLIVTVKLGQATAAMTADEKAGVNQESEQSSNDSERC